MAKAIQAFIDDSGEPVQPGDEFGRRTERLLVLRRLGLVDDSPPALPWTRPRPAEPEPKPEPRVTRAKRQGRPGSGRRLVLSLM